MFLFIRKTILFLLSIIVSSLMLYNLEYPEGVEKFKRIGHGIDIINLGTSHGESFLYDELPLNGKAFHKPANTLYYDLQNYLYLKSHLNDNAIVIIPVSYFSFGLDENRTDRGMDNAFVADFYHYLPTRSIYSYSLRRNTRIFIHQVQTNFKSLFGLNPSGKPTTQNADQTDHKADLEAHAIGRVKHHKKIGTFSAASKNVLYLSQIVADAIDSGFKPVLVTTPYFQRYNALFGQEWLEANYYSHIREIRQQYPIPHFDYGRDARFSFDSGLFFNSDHLNHEGRVKFSTVFFKDLFDALQVNRAS